MNRKGFLKKAILISIVPVFCFAIWVVGIVLEFEYPYILSINRAKNSHTITGRKSKEVISEQLGIDQNKIDFHRCSYCAHCEDGFPENTIRIQVVYENKNYIFAYNRKRNILYPASHETELKFPSMGENVRNENGSF